MRKYQIVKEAKEFDIIIHKGQFFKNDCFIVYYYPNKYTYPRFGIAVSTKLGKAHLRNKYKRQIRMIVDQNKKVFPNKQDYIIILRKNGVNLNYVVKASKLTELFKENK
jgi:ribonuclease P protein component